MKATHLECSLCGKRHEAGAIANLCDCGGPLLVRYDFSILRHRWPRREVSNGPANMWRYAPVLPAAPESVVTLGEGWTPLVRTSRLGARIGAESLWVKDEGLNPTASFKARGLSCAVSMCVELGIRKVAIPSAGNAASAMAAYAAAAGIEAHIFMPRDVPQANFLEWKAFDEMEKLGWIGSRRPKMIAVQAEGCQPVVRAFQENEARSRFYDNAHTMAAGLRVPKPLGDFLVLQGVRESGGTAIAVSDDEMLEAGVQMASDEGIFAAPEGAACVDAAARLLRSRFLKITDRIVIYNTGSGLKYPEAYSTRFPRTASSEQDKLGGLITPR